MTGKKNNRRNRRRAGKGRAENQINAGSAGRGITTYTYPNVIWKKLKYADTGYLTEAGVGSGATWAIRTGDAYDPDVTNTGHQPLYFDQFCTSTGPYLLHCTPRSKIRVTFDNVTNMPVIATIVVISSANAPSSKTIAQERANSWTALLAPAGTTGARKVHVATVDNPTVMGLPLASYLQANAANYGGSCSCPIMYVQVWAPTGGGVVASVSVNVEIELTTRFSQLGPMGGS